MTAEQKAASAKAARILELSEKATADWTITKGANHWLIDAPRYGVVAELFVNCANPSRASAQQHNADWIAETRTIAPDVATALIDAHAEIERLKSAAKEYIDAVEAWGRIGVNRPKHVHNAAAKRRTAALDALKEITG